MHLSAFVTMKRLVNVWETGQYFFFRNWCKIYQSCGFHTRLCLIKIITNFASSLGADGMLSVIFPTSVISLWPFCIYVHRHTNRLMQNLTFPKIRRQIEFYTRRICVYRYVNIPGYMYTQRRPVQIQTPADWNLIVRSMTVHPPAFSPRIIL